MNQVFFKDIRSHIVPLLDKATNRIQIAMAWFTSHELYDALIKALYRKVDVELILLDDAINYMYYAPDFNDFIKAGGKLHIARIEYGFMHHKFCIIDDRITITGSYNWTYYAETRNIENILVTDESQAIAQYSSEFRRLFSKFPLSTSCPRLSWNEIEANGDIDFDELNYEIEQICNIQHIQARKFFKTKTEVINTDLTLTPKSKYDIGIQVFNENNEVIFKPIIRHGEKLPYSTSEILYFDSKNENKFPCLFLFGNPADKNEWHLIGEEDLMQIAEGTNNLSLPIKFIFNLDDSGSLRIDVECTETKKRLTVKASDSKYVDYE